MRMLAIWILGVSMACHGLAHVTLPRRAKLAADTAFKTRSLAFPYVIIGSFGSWTMPNTLKKSIEFSNISRSKYKTNVEFSYFFEVLALPGAAKGRVTSNTAQTSKNKYEKTSMFFGCNSGLSDMMLVVPLQK